MDIGIKAVYRLSYSSSVKLFKSEKNTMDLFYYRREPNASLNSVLWLDTPVFPETLYGDINAVHFLVNILCLVRRQTPKFEICTRPGVYIKAFKI